MLPSIAATFSKELLPHKLFFQKSCYFTATLSTATVTMYQLVIKGAQHQLLTLQLWDFFFVYLLLLKVT